MSDLTGVFGGAFDARTVNPESEFTPIPAGDYLAMIVDSGMKETKDKRGQYLELVHEIIDGPYKGRKVWERLNLVNANEQTVAIAKRQLSNCCHGVNVFPCTDSQQLHNKPVLIRVKFEKGEGNNNDKNSIKEWKSASGTPAPTGYVAPANDTAAAAPAAGAATPPWLKGKAA